MYLTVRQIALLSFVCISGSIITILLKSIDEEKAVGVGTGEHYFFHPFVQVFVSVFGEALGLIYYGILYFIFQYFGIADTHPLTRGRKKVKFIQLIIPNILNLIATSLHFFGLYFTYVSSFQIFRGTILLFVPVISHFVFKDRLSTYKVLAILIMLAGLLFCGISDYISESVEETESYDLSSHYIGDLLIIIGQMFHSVQIVIEEKDLRTHDNPPLYFVGLKGVVGIGHMIVILAALQYIPDPWTDTREKPRLVMEDTEDAVLQMINSPKLLYLMLAFMILCSVYCFTLLYAAKEVNCTNTIIFVASKTIVVWFLSIFLMNDEFHFVQVFGCSLFIIGVIAYNNLIPIEELNVSSID